MSENAARVSGGGQSHGCGNGTAAALKPHDHVLSGVRKIPAIQWNIKGRRQPTRYVALTDWFRNKLGNIVLGDGRVECDWTQENNYVISDFAPGAHDGKLRIPPLIVPGIDFQESNTVIK